ncbi:MAG: hypothetical protein GX129_04320 [Clostridiales bacterium]|jgi:hypothetical protein|nr:hypothetical protein [Clostridiales bacterium]
MSRIADKLYDLGFGLAAATYSVSEIIGYTDQRIRLDIEFKTKYNKSLLPELPNGWGWCDFQEPVRTVDRWGHYHTENGSIKSSLIYSKRINYKDIQKAQGKAIRVIEELLVYLNTFDRDGIMAVMTLLDS